MSKILRNLTLLLLMAIMPSIANAAGYIDGYTPTGKYNRVYDLYTINTDVVTAGCEGSFNDVVVDGVYVRNSSNTVYSASVNIMSFLDGKVHHMQFRYEGMTTGNLYFQSTCTVVDNVMYMIDETAGTSYVYKCSSTATSITINSTYTRDEVEYTVDGISNYAFSSKSKLTEVLIPETITNIGNYAFSGCTSLESIVVPQSVNSLGQSVFNNCSALTSITCEAAEPPTGTNIFNGFDKSKCVLYVPAGTIEKYSNDSQWSGFMEYIEIPYVLTVNFSGQGEILYSGNALSGETVFEGSNFDFIILAADGWVISSALFEGQDVSSQIVNHHFAINALENDAALDIEFAPVSEPQFATLRIKNGDMHAMTHNYAAGSDVNIRLHPDEGWSVHSVTVNDEDLTDQVDDNLISLPSLQGENTMSVVYIANTTNNVAKIKGGNRLHVTVNENTISVADKADDDIVEVYDIDGRMLYSGKNNTVVLPQSQGTIIVKVRNQTFKTLI